MELVYRKSVHFVGGNGGGKTILCQALARRECVRQDTKLWYDGKGNFDGLGLLTREGYMLQFGAMVMGDFSFTFGQRELLHREEIKGILQTEEQCEHKARYFNGRWPEERARMFSMNAGQHEDGTTDHGAWFAQQGLTGLALLARGDEEDCFGR